MSGTEAGWQVEAWGCVPDYVADEKELEAVRAHTSILGGVCLPINGIGSPYHAHCLSTGHYRCSLALVP
eukprot:3127793-Rhodomonas_salina.1